MQLQNKNRIAYLGAITLLFSYAELLLPRIFPFFRLGLGNIVILLALNLSFLDFLVLTIIKAIANSMMAGTLISPFFLISISQSVISGLVMYGLFKIRKNWLSIFGISLIGSAISSFIQILLSSLYLGQQTFKLLGPMLLFSIFSGIFTAWCSLLLKIPAETPQIQLRNQEKSNLTKNIVFCCLILIAIIICFMLKNLWILAGFFLISVILQLITGRHFKFLPHFSIWIFVIFVSLFTPNGKVLLQIGKISITQGAILDGITKALKLSTAACLSQCAANLKPNQKNILGLTLAYYRFLLENFKNQNGNFFTRLANCFSSPIQPESHS